MHSPADAIRAEREGTYGNHIHGGIQLGRMWAGILSQYYQVELNDLPPDIVEIMMVAVKLCRMSQPKGRGHEDSHLDAHAYLDMAKESYLTTKERNELNS